MPKRKMLVEWDDDAQLSESRKKPGQKSPLTRDANNKLSHVTLSEVPDDESTSNSDPIFIYVSDSYDSERRTRDDETVELVSNLVLYAVRTAPEWAPVVQRWWVEQGLPGLKSRWTRLPRPLALRRRAQQIISAEQADTETIDADQSSLTDLDAPRPTMSRDEAQRRLEAALAARRFSDEQLEVLRGARIIDDELPEVEGTVDSVPTLSAGDSIQPSIEPAPRALDEGLAGIILSEEGSADMDHARVPVKPGKVKRVLRQRRVR